MIHLKKAMAFLAFTFMCMVIIGSFPAVTSACSCAQLPSVGEELERSKAVFSGKVLDIKEKKSLQGFPNNSVLFEVMENWKGAEQSQVIITTGQGDGDCGIDFTEGNEYLVYANESTMYGAKSLGSIICDRTDLLSASKEDLAVLGQGQSPIEEVDLTGKQNKKQIYVWVTLGAAVCVVMFFIFRRGKLS